MRPAKAAHNSRQDIIPVPGAGRETTGPGVSADSTAPMGQARSNPPHLVHTSPSPLKNTLTPGGALMRMNRNTTALRTMCVYVLSRSVVSDSATPWTAAHQAPLSMGFPRQEYWSGLPFPPPGDLPDPGIEPVSLASPA